LSFWNKEVPVKDILFAFSVPALILNHFWFNVPVPWLEVKIRLFHLPKAWLLYRIRIDTYPVSFKYLVFKDRLMHGPFRHALLWLLTL